MYITILLNQYVTVPHLLFCFVFKGNIPFIILFFTLYSSFYVALFPSQKYDLFLLSFTLNAHGCLPFFPSGVSSNLLIPSGSNVCKPLSMYFLFHCLLCLFLQCHYSLLWDIFLLFCFVFPLEIQSGDLKKHLKVLFQTTIQTLEVSFVIASGLHVLWCSMFYIENI